jgi:hypothetical protein
MHQMTTAKPPVRIIVRIAAFLLVLVVMVAGLEVGLRLLLPNAQEGPIAREVAQRLNGPEENRTDLPLYLPRQGGDCVRRDTSKMRWNPRFGYNSKTLDKACAERLFANGKISVVMLGGSTMANAGARNYLTTLDHYAFGDDQDIVSINLAEPGARLWNMMSRFIEDVISLKPAFVVYFGGPTEFYSLHHGGRPGDDTHWAISIRQRVESPTMASLDALLKRSRLVQVAQNAAGTVAGPWGAVTTFDDKRVHQDAGYYLQARDTMQVLCRHYGVRCLFILQPLALLEQDPSGSTAAIVQQNLRFFPNDRQLFTRGYELMRQGGGEDQLDASQLLRGRDDAYLDVAHLSKIGNAVVGKFFYSAIMKARDGAPPQ